jgi:UDP-N-acetylglucosamine 2-epimerase (non-hydrolysing)
MYSVILGTRPEIIKMSPVIREFERLNLDYFILHTGQHYDYNMNEVLFEQLNLPEPTYALKVGSGSHGEQTGKMIIEIEKILRMEEPSIVLVQGDTNTCLSGALAASKIGLKVGHVEAGLRSYDRRMPEEINRVIVDHISDYLFAPTDKSQMILLGESIPEEKIFVTGNTIVDAVLQNLEISRRRNVLYDFGLAKGGFFLVTVHRQENVDEEARFRGIIKGLEYVHEETDFEVIWPIHPRAKKRLKALGLELRGVEVIDPLDYLSFLQLESNARLVLTDSGGVQEETCILGVPCVTLRDNTERPETLEVGSNVLAGINPQSILDCVKFMLSKDAKWFNPFGDGRASQRITRILMRAIPHTEKEKDLPIMELV